MGDRAARYLNGAWLTQTAAPESVVSDAALLGIGEGDRHAGEGRGQGIPQRLDVTGPAVGGQFALGEDQRLPERAVLGAVPGFQ